MPITTQQISEAIDSFGDLIADAMTRWTEDTKKSKPTEMEAELHRNKMQNAVRCRQNLIDHMIEMAVQERKKTPTHETDNETPIR